MATDVKKSYLHSPMSYEVASQTVQERLLQLACEFEEKEIYIFYDERGGRSTISARELYNKSKDFAAKLADIGFQKGDVIGVSLPNSIDHLVCIFGVILSGAIFQSLVFISEDSSDTADILNKTKCSGIILHPGPNDVHYNTCLKIIDDMQCDGSARSKLVESLRYFILAGTLQGDYGYCPLLLKTLLEKQQSYSDTFSTDLETDDIAILLPTSGSTGAPKYVPFSNKRMLICGMQLQESSGCTVDDILYNDSRMSWAGGFPFKYLNCGLTTVVPTFYNQDLELHSAFIENILRKELCGIARVMPNIMKSLTSRLSSSETFKRLQNIYITGSPVSSSCMEAIGEITEKISVCYGSSESGLLTSVQIRNPQDFTDYSCGKPLQGVEVKVTDENGALVSRGVRGDIFAKGVGLFDGYYYHENTSSVLTEDGWYCTGDVGYVTEDGCLVMEGRKSDILTCEGIQVMPSSIESLVKFHPAVLDAVVVALPDSEECQRPCVCFIPFRGSNVTEAEIKFSCESIEAPGCRVDLATILSKTVFMKFDAFPKTNTGKIDKRKIISIAIQMFKTAS